MSPRQVPAVPRSSDERPVPLEADRRARSVPPVVLRRLYTVLAPFYDRLVPLVSSTARTLGISRLDVRDGERILDVGCGTGRALRALAAATPSGWTEGLDATPTMVRRARSRLRALPHDRYRIRRGDARALPHPEDAFDAVFSSYVLDVLPGPAANRALREMRRVLRPDGRLVLVVWVPPTRLLERLWAALAHTAPALLGGARPLRPQPLLERAGFSVESATTRTQLGLRSGILRARPR